jgi:hypothetical protein
MLLLEKIQYPSFFCILLDGVEANRGGAFLRSDQSLGFRSFSRDRDA